MMIDGVEQVPSSSEDRTESNTPIIRIERPDDNVATPPFVESASPVDSHSASMLQAPQEDGSTSRRLSEVDKDDLRRRLEQFFEVKNPAKLSDIEIILQRYEGNEAELLTNLVGKYGALPGVIDTSRPPSPQKPSRGLTAGGSKSQSLDELMATVAMSEEEMRDIHRKESNLRRQQYTPTENAVSATRKRLDMLATARQEKIWTTALVRDDGVKVLPGNLSAVRSGLVFPQEPSQPSGLYEGLVINANFWSGFLELLNRAPTPTVARLTSHNIAAANEQFVHSRELFERYQINGYLSSGAVALCMTTSGVPTSDGQATALIHRCNEGRKDDLLDEANFVRLMQVTHTQISRALVAQKLMQRSPETDINASKALDEIHSAAAKNAATSEAATPKRQRSPSRSPSPSSSRLPRTSEADNVSGIHTLKSLQIASASPSATPSIRGRSSSPVMSHRSPSVGTARSVRSTSIASPGYKERMPPSSSARSAATRITGASTTPRRATTPTSARLASRSPGTTKRSIPQTTASPQARTRLASPSPGRGRPSQSQPLRPPPNQAQAASAEPLEERPLTKQEKLLQYLNSPKHRPKVTSQPSLKGHHLLTKASTSSAVRRL